MILFIGSPEHWEDRGSLLYSVQTGKPATTKLRGMPYFDHLHRNPDQAAVFNNAMSTMSALANDAVLSAYDFTDCRLIVDGGHGLLLASMLNGAPNAKGVLYDLPSVVEGAPPVLEVADRCTVPAVLSSTRYRTAATRRC